MEESEKRRDPSALLPHLRSAHDTVERALLKFAHTPAEILTLCSLPTELVMAARASSENLFLESYSWDREARDLHPWSMKARRLSSSQTGARASRPAGPEEGVPGRQGLPHPMVLVLLPPEHRLAQTRSEVQRESPAARCG